MARIMIDKTKVEQGATYIHNGFELFMSLDAYKVYDVKARKCYEFTNYKAARSFFGRVTK